MPGTAVSYWLRILAMKLPSTGLGADVSEPVKLLTSCENGFFLPNRLPRNILAGWRRSDIPFSTAIRLKKP